MYLHGHSLSHDEDFERSSPVSLLIYFPCTRKHIYTSRDKRGVDEQRDSFRRTSDFTLISLGEPRKKQDVLLSPKVGTLEATPLREDDNWSGMSIRARRSFLRENAKKRAGNCVSDAAR